MKNICVIVFGLFLGIYFNEQAFTETIQIQTELEKNNDGIIERITKLSLSQFSLMSIFYDNKIRSTCMTSPYVSIGSFYTNGLLSIISNPLKYQPDNTIFIEKTGFDLNFNWSGSHFYSIVINPLPDILSVYYLQENQNRKIIGLSAIYPILQKLKVEILIENINENKKNDYDSWFYKSIVFQGIELWELSGRFKFDFGKTCLIIANGYSINKISEPGFFILAIMDLKLPFLNMSLLTGYQSKNYITPDSRNLPECIQIGGSIDFKIQKWIFLKSKICFWLYPQLYDSEYDMNIIVNTKKISSICNNIDMSFYFKRDQNIDICDDEKGISIACNLDFENILFKLKYQYKYKNNESEHILGINNQLILSDIRMKNQIQYNIMKNCFDISIQLVIDKNPRVTIEIDSVKMQNTNIYSVQIKYSINTRIWN